MRSCFYILILSTSSCHATGGDPAFWDAAPRPSPTGGATSEGGQGGMQEGVGANSPDGDLLFEVTTVTYDGEYAPDHVSAFWVEDAEGVFVKTLEVAAAKRIQYLRRWREASSENVVDAVTGATLPEHGPRQVHWDLTDTSGRTVPFGLYRVVAEMSEHNGAGTWVSTPFEVSNEPLEIDEPGGPGFIDLRLLYTP